MQNLKAFSKRLKVSQRVIGLLDSQNTRALRMAEDASADGHRSPPELRKLR